MSSAICHFMKQVQDAGEVRLFKSSEPEKYADGGQQRDFVYVKDAARWTCDLLTKEAYGIYNVGTGTPHTWNALAKAVFKGLKKPETIQYVEMPQDLTGKYQNYTCADMEKLSAAFGGDLGVTPFEESVVEYVEQYLAPNKYW